MARTAAATSTSRRVRVRCAGRRTDRFAKPRSGPSSPTPGSVGAVWRLRGASLRVVRILA
ncbi:hypothetical protein [Ornithinimicrobium kibberense]|uniref:hypothetical protein n=1 Tax=Ornithinimicrobium kibberense TaxID=282060 RepID=UPI00361D5884